MIEPSPGVAEWTELPGLSKVAGFAPFVLGALAECGPRELCALGPSNELVATDVELPLFETFWGVWNDDLWHVEIAVEEGEEPDDERAQIEVWTTLHAQRWQGDRGFVTVASYDEDGTYSRDLPPEVVLRKGWAGGMVVRERDRLHRLPETGPPLPNAETLPRNLLELFEPNSGALAFVTIEDQPRGPPQLLVHPPCATGSCRERALGLAIRQADGLPEQWDFPLDVARGGDSLTIVAVAHERDVYLLHHEGGPKAWTFEALPKGTPVPDAIWPDAHRGLWIAVFGSLWYRDAAGQWFDVALPGSGVAIDFANRLEPREFLALVDGDPRRVFATRGPAGSQ